jgi:hypothetical protein
MQSKLGELLEAMKEYHMAVSSTEDIERAMSTVFDESVTFIKRQKGVWGHAEWEDFVKTIQQNTKTWTEGTEAYLGGVLESLKVFYKLSPVAADTPGSVVRTITSSKSSAAKAGRAPVKKSRN